MKKLLTVFLFAITLGFGSDHAGKELESLIEKHEDANEIHENQLITFNNIFELLRQDLLTKENIIFALRNEADLLYVVIQAEGERFNMITAKIKGLLTK